MSLLLQYGIKLSLALAVVWIFYAVLLRRLTFYTINRWYLVVYSALALLVPFIDITPVIEQNDWTSNGIVRFVPTIDNYHDETSSQNSFSFFEKSNLIVSVFAVGVGIMIIRLLVLFVSLIQIRRKSFLVNDNGVKLYQVSKKIIPFSFGNSIFINQEQHEQRELEQIIRHEFIHVKQKHSLDIMWAELLCIFNWYNPFAWLIRRSIRQNLEFIADHQVLQSGLDKKQYQYLLLKVIGIAPISIANNFNLSSLKMRIAMMNKIRSSKLSIARFLLLVPMLAITLLAFRNNVQKNEPSSVSEVLMSELPVSSDTIPSKTSNNSSVQTIDAEHVRIVVKDEKATVLTADGVVEKYDLSKESEKKKFYFKYAHLLAPPPPPTPARNGKAPVASVSPAPASVSTPAAAAEIEPAKLQETVPVPPAPPVPPATRKDEVVVTGRLIPGAEPGTPSKAPLDEVVVVGYGTRKGGSPVASSAGRSDGRPAKVNSGGGTVSSEPLEEVKVSGYGTSPAKPVRSGPSTDLEEVIITGVQPPAPPAASVPRFEDGVQLLEIKRRTTEAEINKLKEDLSKKGIELTIDDIKFENGIITFIKGKVVKGTHKASFVSDNFTRLVVTEVKFENGKTGMHIWISDGRAAV